MSAEEESPNPPSGTAGNAETAQQTPAPRRGRGRPTKLTPEIQERILETLRACGTIEDACVMAGVDEATYTRWKNRGLKERTGIYREFCTALRQTLVQRRIAREATVINAGKEDWRATAWMMERSDPKRYAPRVFQHIEKELDGAIERIKEAFADDPEALERALTALAGGQSDDGIGEDPPSTGGEVAGGGEAVLPASTEPEAEALPRP